MKKRSLFAAVAMLIVSAMVLTSATYAWFNVGGGAKVVTTRGSVMEAQAGVRLKLDKSGARWVSTLLPQDFNGATGCSFVQDWTATKSGSTYTLAHGENWDDDAAYAPMSSDDGQNFFMYEMGEGNAFQLSSNNGSSANYRDSYQFHIATVSNTANITGTFTLKGVDQNDTCAAAARAVVFISTNNGSSWSPYQIDTDNDDVPDATAIFTGGSEADSTYAVAAALTTTIYDDGSGHTPDAAGVNYIMDAEDTGFAANLSADKFTEITTAQMVDASSGTTITINSVPNTNSSNVMVKTVIWIEGQDGDCAPSLGGGSVTSDWTFAVATA